MPPNGLKAASEARLGLLVRWSCSWWTESLCMASGTITERDEWWVAPTPSIGQGQGQTDKERQTALR